MGRETAFYDAAACYDLLHAADTEAELSAVLELHTRFGNGGRRVLEPACGTGRYLEALARRGFTALGYDTNRNVLAFARRRLRPWGAAAGAVRGDMRAFRRPGAFDLAFNTLGSIRHLLTQGDALRHLRAVARSLRPGGLYVVGLDLTDYSSAQDDEETWEASRDGVRVRHVMVSLAPRRDRRETILNFVTVTEKGRERVLESAYPLRSYDAGEWRALIAASPFRLAGEAPGLFALTSPT